MNASERCIAAIKQAEGFRAQAYRDAVGVWTIGYGETFDRNGSLGDASSTGPGGRNVKPGDVVTLAEADARLRARLAVCAYDVQQLARVPLTQGELDALVDFEYNLGRSSLAHSTLLAKLKAGDLDGAAAEFPRWSKAGGKVLAGLLARRLQEQTWFREPPASLAA